MKKITVIFELNEPQWEHVQEQSKLEPGWHYCNLVIRTSGQDKYFEADYMRAFFQAVRLNSSKEEGNK